MSCQHEQYRTICGPEFRELHHKLDRLDEAIRGNGKIGIQQRLDRLEQLEIRRRKLTWVIIGAFASAGASAVLGVIQLLSRL